MEVNGTDVNKVTVVLGAQWGDEGKGKVVDMLATDADLVCRCQVSAKAVCTLPRPYIVIVVIAVTVVDDDPKPPTGR